MDAIHNDISHYFNRLFLLSFIKSERLMMQDIWIVIHQMKRNSDWEVQEFWVYIKHVQQIEQRYDYNFNSSIQVVWKLFCKRKHSQIRDKLIVIMMKLMNNSKRRWVELNEKLLDSRGSWSSEYPTVVVVCRVKSCFFIKRLIPFFFLMIRSNSIPI